MIDQTKRGGGKRFLPWLMFTLAVVVVILLSNPVTVRSSAVSREGEDALPKRLHPFQTIVLPEVNAEHYTFRGWKDIRTGEYVDTVSWTWRDFFGHNLYADFEPEGFAVHYYGENGKEIAEGEYFYGIGMKLPSACSDGKYHAGWIDENGNVVEEIPADEIGDKEYTVLFADYPEAVVKPCDIYTGKAGTISIGDINNPMYTAVLEYGQDQEIADDPEKANDFWKENLRGTEIEIICDHAYDGFRAIMYSQEAYITKNGVTEKYECIHRHQGYNSGTDLLLMNEKSALNLYEDSDIVMYTCNDEEGVSVSITWWKKADSQG